MKAILFDFDDTLGNREVSAYNYYRALLQKHLETRDALTAECIIQDCLITDKHGNAPKADIQKMLENKYGIQLGFDLQTYWNDHFYPYYELFADTEEVLRYLKQKYLLGVITNGSEEGQSKKITATGAEKWFDVILISGREGIAKPDPQIFLLAAQRLGIPASECVFVGDTFSNDIQGAVKAGMEAVWMWPHGYRSCTYPVKRISCLSELKELY